MAKRAKLKSEVVTRPMHGVCKKEFLAKKAPHLIEDHEPGARTAGGPLAVAADVATGAAPRTYSVISELFADFQRVIDALSIRGDPRYVRTRRAHDPRRVFFRADAFRTDGRWLPVCISALPEYVILLHFLRCLLTILDNPVGILVVISR